MKLAVTGAREAAAELKDKLSSEVQVNHFTGDNIPEDADMVIDLDFDSDTLPAHYAELQKPVVLNGVFRQLAHISSSYTQKTGKQPVCRLFGLCALPTLVGRSLKEVSSLDINERPVLEELAAKLGWTLKWVDDRVGMVSPRVICMIINEAFYTLQEGTASEADIDLGMKLGTNYPNGPFEWVDKMGVYNVYRTLEAVYEDTRDERYKICPLLRTRMLRKHLA